MKKKKRLMAKLEHDFRTAMKSSVETSTMSIIVKETWELQ